MALPRFFDRVYIAAGQSLSISREELETLLGRQRVAVRAGPLCRTHENARWIAELTVNVLARLYPTLCLGGEEEICEALRDLAVSVNPAIEIRNSLRGRVVIDVGTEPLSSPRSILPFASGWVAGLSLGSPAVSYDCANPYSAAAAASFACAEVFRRCFRSHLPKPYRRPSVDYSLSLLDHTTSGGIGRPLDAQDLGPVVVAGVGAVANPALWALARHPGLSGELWLVDGDVLDLGNMERYVLALDRNVEEEITKVALGARALEGSGIRVHPERLRLDEFASTAGAVFSFPTICVSVDDIEPRRDAQSLLPKLVINGATGEGNAGASWHEFDGVRPCLCCLYHPGNKPKSQTRQVADAIGLDNDIVRQLWVEDRAPSPEHFEIVATTLGLTPDQKEEWRGRSVREFYSGFICGAVRMSLEGAKKAASVPLAHQSLLAGALMAAEIVKRTSPALSGVSQQHCGIQATDVRAPLGPLWLSPGPNRPVPDCICQDPDYRAVHAEKWSGSGSAHAKKGVEPGLGVGSLPPST